MKQRISKLKKDGIITENEAKQAIRIISDGEHIPTLQNAFKRFDGGDYNALSKTLRQLREGGGSSAPSGTSSTPARAPTTFDPFAGTSSNVEVREADPFGDEFFGGSSAPGGSFDPFFEVEASAPPAKNLARRNSSGRYLNCSLIFFTCTSYCKIFLFLVFLLKSV